MPQILIVVLLLFGCKSRQMSTLQSDASSASPSAAVQIDMPLPLAVTFLVDKAVYEYRNYCRIGMQANRRSLSAASFDRISLDIEGSREVKERGLRYINRAKLFRELVAYYYTPRFNNVFNSEVQLPTGERVMNLDEEDFYPLVQSMHEVATATKTSFQEKVKGYSFEELDNLFFSIRLNAVEQYVLPSYKKYIDTLIEEYGLTLENYKNNAGDMFKLTPIPDQIMKTIEADFLDGKVLKEASERTEYHQFSHVSRSRLLRHSYEILKERIRNGARSSYTLEHLDFVYTIKSRALHDAFVGKEGQQPLLEERAEFQRKSILSVEKILSELEQIEFFYPQKRCDEISSESWIETRFPKENRWFSQAIDKLDLPAREKASLVLSGELYFSVREALNTDPSMFLLSNGVSQN